MDCVTSFFLKVCLVNLTAVVYGLCIAASYKKCRTDCYNSSGQEIVQSPFIHVEVVFVPIPCFRESPLCFIPDVWCIIQMLLY